MLQPLIATPCCTMYSHRQQAPQWRAHAVHCQQYYVKNVTAMCHQEAHAC